MCWQITILLFGIIVVHMVPKESHYKYIGTCMPNSTIEWSPEPTNRRGMVFLTFYGDGSLFWDNSEMPLQGKAFAHMYGQIPRIDYKAKNSSLKVTAHLIT